MNNRTIRLLIVVLSAVLFMPFLGSVHLFDWDEINFAECAREMIVTGDYLHVRIDYATFAEKPPLFIWLQAACMHVFGINEFAARLPNALIGTATLLLLFEIGRRLRDRTFGIIWCLAYVGAILPHFYARSGIIDPLFNLLIFLGILLMRRSVWLAGLCTGLAVLTKGPVGWGMVMMVTGIWWLIERRSRPLPWREILMVTGVAILVNSLWYAADVMQNGLHTVQENLAYQFRLLSTGDAGHAQPFWYHFAVVLVGCFPASILAISGMRNRYSTTPQQTSMHYAMLVLLWCTLVVFSIVKTKIVHYSSLTYLPLTYLAAAVAYQWIRNGIPWRRWWSIALVLLTIVWTAVGFAVPWAFIHSDMLLALPTFRDVFLRASLQVPVEWTGAEPYVALLIPIAAIVCILLARSGNKLHSLYVAASGTSLFIWLFLPFVAPKIERYTQGPAIDFYESLRGKDVYVKPLTYKSYAHLFYTNKPPALSATAMGIGADDFEPWLLNRAIDKPAYFVSKINDAGPWLEHPNLRELYRRGGFVFFQRIPLPGSGGVHHTYRP